MAKKKGLGRGLDALLGDAFVAAAEMRKVNKVDGNAATKANVQPESLIHKGLANDLARLTGEAGNQVGAAAKNKPSINLDKGFIESIEKPAQLIAPTKKSTANVLLDVPIEFCQRGKYQPRRDTDPASLEELAASIRSQGIMQPIIIRSLESSNAGVRYEIIAGERRWKAAQLVGLDTVPAVLKEVPDEAAIAMALIENLQREDLNPMEESYALSRLQQEFELTHQQVAEAVGKSRASVSNSLRLMSLQKDVKLMLENGDLDMGHARALLMLDAKPQCSAAKEIVNKSLTVRQTEVLVKNIQVPKKGKTNEQEKNDPNIDRLQNELSEKLGVPVSFQHSARGGGKIVLKYHSLDELDGILSHIK